MIPTSIDGTDITGATIDGTDVTEITVDGQTVFTASQLAFSSSFESATWENDFQGDTGNPSRTSTRSFDGSFSIFNSSDGIAITADIPALSPPYTASVYIFHDGGSFSELSGMILGEQRTSGDDVPQNGFYGHIEGRDDQFRMFRRVNGSSEDSTVTNVNVTGSWVEIKAEVSSTTLEWYVDGNLQHTHTNPFGDLFVGLSWGTGNSFMDLFEITA
jgi:hypothetical protein